MLQWGGGTPGGGQSRPRCDAGSGGDAPQQKRAACSGARRHCLLRLSDAGLGGDTPQQKGAARSVARRHCLLRSLVKAESRGHPPGQNWAARRRTRRRCLLFFPIPMLAATCTAGRTSSPKTRASLASKKTALASADWGPPPAALPPLLRRFLTRSAGSSSPAPGIPRCLVGYGDRRKRMGPSQSRSGPSLCPRCRRCRRLPPRPPCLSLPMPCHC